MRKSGIAFLAAAAAAAALLAHLAPAAPALAQMQSPAQSPAPPAASGEDARAAESNAAWEAGAKAGTRGPADITLIDQGTLKLRAVIFFTPTPGGARIWGALGNTIHEPTFVGLVIGTRDADQWVVVARYIKEGYIKDDDAKDWNADDLLQSLKDGTAEANRDRAARGFGELEVLGWVEKPAYDVATHRLVWSLLSKEKGEPDSAEKGVNYNTYALGRDGYFSLNLLTSSSQVEADKAVAHTLLAALSYNPGKGYEDFNVATDHIAAYGIAALVGGVVAKKLGLLALIGVFVLKFAKVIGIAVLAFGAGILNFFRRKPKSAGASGNAPPNG
jgi:uncharacterized membrane-anchored protein